MIELNKDNIIEFYDEYKKEINYDKIYRTIKGMMCSFERKMLYCMIRGIKPQKIIEIGPYHGYSTVPMIYAMQKNNIKCSMYSFDLINKSDYLDYDNVLTSRTLIVGDVRDNIDNDYIKDCEFIFIDNGHKYEDGEWYSRNILSYLPKNAIIAIHDWEGYDHSELEMLAVKEHAINKDIVKPVINLMDYVIENIDNIPELSSNRKNQLKFGRGDRSPTQILRKI